MIHQGIENAKKLDVLDANIKKIRTDIKNNQESTMFQRDNLCEKYNIELPINSIEELKIFEQKLLSDK